MTQGSKNEPHSAHLLAPELVSGLAAFPAIDFSNGMDAFRSGFTARETPPLPPELATVECEERRLPGRNGAPDVRVLLYTPPGRRRSLRPALLHIHGGGYVLGNPEINDISNRMVALDLGCTVLSVDYRLAPETVWPGALEDCYAALCWLHDNAERIGIDASRIAVAGESAGGGHAVALALYARKLGGPSLCFMQLDAPMLDDRTGSTSEPHPWCGEFVWTPAHNRFGWKSLLGTEPGGADVPTDAVPARAADYKRLPPAFISVGALDLFFEENLEFARRLSRDGVPVELHVTPGAYHGFGIAQNSPQFAQASQLRRQALARALAAPGSGFHG